MKNLNQVSQGTGSEIAIIGMAGRFPGARNLLEFWKNLRDGIESVRFFSDEEILAGGIDPELLRRPNYVKAGAILDGVEWFDASFFGYNPREAEIMDPQHRLFLEVAWEAMENAGYDTERYDGLVGVFAGSGQPSYLISIHSRLELNDPLANYYAIIGNDKDYLSTRVSYKLDLKGPSLGVQCACSSSLVAVHLACQSLLNEECDMALAGAASVMAKQKWGYLYEPDTLSSPDGHVRAFDAEARGTVFGEGVGAVILKRLADALADGDQIHATIKGSAVNNDGNLKVAFTAPSLFGQAEVITEAMANAGVVPDSISYIETHGTGTALGDPIEIAALTQVYGAGTGAGKSIPIGSVKTNLGHPNTAAGIAGLIKTVLSLKHRQLPPSLNFSTPNPKIDFASGPFYVNTELRQWETPSAEQVRRAGVSSFGMGGTNAHVILEEAPTVAAERSRRPYQLLVVSARTEGALERATQQLAQRLEEESEEDSGDIAYTLGVGRREFSWRRTVVCRGRADAVAALSSLDPQFVLTELQETRDRPVVFMFPGGGAQYAEMSRELYAIEPEFRRHYDHCAELFLEHLDEDLRRIISPVADDRDVEQSARLIRTSRALPALFSVEYALSQLWLSWGIRPQAMIGHSLGEYAAACLAGVLSLEQTVGLVALRGRLFEELPAGAMLAVELSEEAARQLFDERLSLAAINGPDMCVISGDVESIEAAEATCLQNGVEARRLHIAVAAHSRLVEPILPEVERFAARLKLRAPAIPYISNVTGTWISDSEATDPGYWARHLRQTVRFSDGVRELLRDPGRVLLEVGPGRTLSTLAKQLQSLHTPSLILPSQPHPEDRHSDLAFILNTLAKLWLGGVRVDWPGFYASERRRRISLPTYPFERQRYWIEPASSADRPAHHALSLEKRPDIADWFSVPVWQQCPPLVTQTNHEATERPLRWLIFTDDGGPGGKLAERLRSEGRTAVTVSAGGEFRRLDSDTYLLSPERAEDYEQLLEHLRLTDRLPHKIVHLWLSSGPEAASSARERWEKAKRLGFNSLLLLAQALGNQRITHDLALYVVTSDMQSVSGTEELVPERAVVLGPCRVFPREYHNLSCKSIDFVSSEFSSVNPDEAVDQLIAEINCGKQETVIAYRGGRRWRQDFEPMNLGEIAAGISRLREQGVYLITGGLGGLGLVMARTLARDFKARLILVGRSTFPPREDWQTWLSTHEQGDATSDKIRQLLEMDRIGAALLIYSADVSDREQMRRVIDLGVAHFGKIDGVIHAAGVMPAGISQVKSLEMADKVLAPKVEGALVLFDLLHDAGLDFLMLCSSVASIAAGVGMVDHCAANSVLDAFGHSNTLNKGLYTISVNWGNWLEVGQAAQAKASSDAPHPSPHQAGRPCAHPLLDQCLSESEGEAIYATELSPEKHWIVGEHKFAGVAAAPGTALLEMVRAAFAERRSGAQKIIFRDVVFLAPLMVNEEESREVQTRLHQDGDQFEFVVMSRGGAASGVETEFQTHVVGKISAIEIDRPPVRPAEQWDASVKEVTELEASQPRHLDYLSLGPHWEGLVHRIQTSSRETQVSVELPLKFHPELESYQLHPSLMDAATFVPSLIGEGVYLPFAYQKLIIHAPLAPKIHSYLRRQTDPAGDGETFAFDIVVTDEGGEVLLEIEEFTLKRVNPTVTYAASSADKSYRASGAERWGSLAPAAGSVAASVSGPGILPAEGAEAFKRTLRRGLVLAQVAVTASDLHALIARTAALTQEKILEAIAEEQSRGQKYARPNVGTAYVGPRSEFEKQMVAIWGELLGIESVGIYDNFFDLGGHSLLATKLVSAVRLKFDATLPLRTIFESPTVAELTLVLVQKQAEQVDGTLLNELLAEIRDLSDAETNHELC